VSHFLDHDPGARMQRERARAIGQFPTNSRWRHYKGNIYRILTLAVNESDLTLAVVYCDDDMGRTWFRPLDEWDQYVRHEGETVRRYERLETHS
jgi:hypothetical protein